jgi:C1A family cysteine protease
MEVSTGWIPDIPDGRDYTLGHAKVREAIGKLRGEGGRKFLTLGDARAQRPPVVDLSADGAMGPVEDQGRTNSCTANAVIGAVEYLYFKGCNERLDLSRLFLYKATRKLLGWYGDPGAFIRTTIKALAMFGAPPEEHWPFDPRLLDMDPDAFVYQMASNFKALVYARLDQEEPDHGRRDRGGRQRETTLDRVRATIADGFPVALGFPVYDSLREDGMIPYPTREDKLLGGHAVLAVGYDDGTELLKVRNSWGPAWGEEGYGYLPYAYVTEQLAADFWAVFSESWVRVGAFGQR